MCGIVGVIAANAYGLTHNEQKLFEQLLYVDALRGDDATDMDARRPGVARRWQP